MNFMLNHVVKARYLGGYSVQVCFDDGAEGYVDLGPFLEGPVFEPLKDPAYFARFEVDQTLVWPNGADFAPEFLRERIGGPTTDGSLACRVTTPGCWKAALPEPPSAPHEVSRFLGLRVRMGVPGVQPSCLVVESSPHRAEIDVETGDARGHLPRRAARYLEEWRRLHLEELRRNVARLERGESALAIDPLE